MSHTKTGCQHRGPGAEEKGGPGDSALFAQFFCVPQTALKKQNLLKQKRQQTHRAFEQKG